MFVADASLMCTHQPSLEQGSHPMAAGQQIVANIRLLAYYFVAEAEAAQSTVSSPPVGADHAAWLRRPLDRFLQAFGRGIRHTSKSNASNASPVHLRGDHYQRFSRGTTPCGSPKIIFERYQTLAWLSKMCVNAAL